jgi:hypothetical protein
MSLWAVEPCHPVAVRDAAMASMAPFSAGFISCGTCSPGCRGCSTQSSCRLGPERQRVPAGHYFIDVMAAYLEDERSCVPERGAETKHGRVHVPTSFIADRASATLDVEAERRVVRAQRHQEAKQEGVCGW